ncbi:ABC transporter permease [Bradyrhizobium sp. SZCCHNS1008]|uniref:ABC transporter permease n=2 Tax=unclassified Bradyrhizobium TaxID=2631580 RepID=UPI0029169BA5|nr:ABC transporter permease [Bradyrhizobium sp. SZCCHNS1008]
MMDLILGYLTIGLVNGSFYALLSLGLALIFGLLNVLNMTHGVLYMMGAFAAWAGSRYLGLDYFGGVAFAPVCVAAFGMMLERWLLRRTYGLDPLYGFMLTFGAAMVVQGAFQAQFGSTGLPYVAPDWLAGGVDFGFLYFPVYRLWVVAVALVTCVIVWIAIARTRLGSILRASSENAAAAEALGVGVPRVFAATFALGSGLAGLAGALAAPIYQVSPLMGSDILLVVFAIIVIGGMGSIAGTIVSSYALALIESLTQALVPQAASFVVFAFMCIVLLLRPQGLFGIPVVRSHEFMAARLSWIEPAGKDAAAKRTNGMVPALAAAAALVALPVLLYPVYLMKVFCFTIFAASFNFLLGFAGIMSFGQAALFGTAAYLTAHAAKEWALPPETAIGIGIAAALGLGLVMGIFAIRRRGIYQAMITLAIAQMIYFVYLQASFTHGEDGIQSVPRGMLLGLIDLREDANVYWLSAAAMLGVLFGLRRLMSSPFGMMLIAIRDNERRALSLGHHVDAYKVAAFGIAAFCAGVAGSLSAIVFQLATLSDAHWHLSGEAVLMALIGGIGTFGGPLIGAAVLVTMQHFLSPFGSWILAVQGAVFILCVLLFRDGLLPQALALTANLRRQHATSDNAAVPRVAEAVGQ